MEPIEIFVTGGTFDKEYDYIRGKLFFENTHLVEMLLRGRCTLDVEVRTLMMIDSLEMEDGDREYILKECLEADSKRIVITHGTDTMVETAHFLAKAKIPDKTLVITGAMIPYAFGSSSDGFFNLGSALAFCQILTPGIYICMNGKYFEYNKVKKNYETGFFEGLT